MGMPKMSEKDRGEKGSKAVIMLAVIFMLWVMISWAEVATKNINPNPKYNSYNAIVLFLKVIK